MKIPWWRHAVVYQVYLRSFADGNADGTGDIAGLRSRLEYLASLGVDAVWVNPWYLSPLADGGYDVADYRRIDPRFGTIEEAKLAIEEAGKHGIRVLVDLVPNHTSSQHAWFEAALAAGPGSAQRGLYHFLPGNGATGSGPPNDWQSVFGGPAWTRVPDGEWYLHLFDVTQPDLNWENPRVRDEFDDVIRFWLDLGAAGFRVDVAHGLVKAAGYPDAGPGAGETLATTQGADHPVWDQPGVHDIARRWRAILDEYDEKVMIAEVWVPDWSAHARYVRPDEYHQTFAFEFLRAAWDDEAMRKVIEDALTGTEEAGSIPTWVLSNHDVVRHATRYGLPKDVVARTWLLTGDRSLLDPELGLRRARAAALLMLSLPGSVYLYQGEELGLPEVADLPEAVLDDPVWTRSGHTEKGRDGCRVPLPWASEGPSFGFGDDGSWLPQPDDWGKLSVEVQDGDPGSTLELYRRAISLRTQLLRHDEKLEWLDVPAGVLAFERGSGVVCQVNFGPSPVELVEGDVILASDPIDDTLAPDTAVWVRA